MKNRESIITLYHGSTYSFDAVDVNLGKPNKDFGRGFYTTRIEQHAADLARRNQQIAQSRIAMLPAMSRKNRVPAWLYTYESVHKKPRRSLSS